MVPLSQQMIIHFAIEKVMLIITYEQAFSHTRESDQQLRG
jgi:hypothetical protein